MWLDENVCTVQANGRIGMVVTIRRNINYCIFSSIPRGDGLYRCRAEEGLVPIWITFEMVIVTTTARLLTKPDPGLWYRGLVLCIMPGWFGIDSELSPHYSICSDIPVIKYFQVVSESDFAS